MARGDGEGTMYQRKDGIWCGQVTIGVDPKTGKQKRKSLYGKTRKEVARKMTDLKKQIFDGTYREPTNIKLGEWLTQWIEGRKSALAYSTYRTYEMMIRNHINPDLGNIKLRKLKSHHIQKLLNDKFENGRIKGDGEGGLSERTVKYIYQTLHAALEKAAEDELILSNPCRKSIDLPKDETRNKHDDGLQTWDKRQVNKFLKAAREHKYFILHYLALNTGMRRGELLGLKWGDIDYKRKRINVHRQVIRTDEGLIFKKVKTESGNRIIPITDDVIKELKKHKIKQGEKRLALGEAYNKKADLVCANGIGNPLDPRKLVKEFKEIAENNKLPEIRYHDTRHTFATLFLEAGGNIKTLQQILGHSSITVTIDTYSHVSEEMLQEAERNMAKMFKVVEDKKEANEQTKTQFN